MQAETYHNCATSLVHSTSDHKTLLAYKLCQAHISDYMRKFLEAASRYHELSFVGEIDENERTLMLYIYTTYFVLCIIEIECRRSAAVTCAVLTPAGPNHSRILSSPCCDERTAKLPTYSILMKMFLDHILRPIKIKKFEKMLKPHQLAQIALSTNDRLSSMLKDGDLVEGASTCTGPTTILDCAVMEHNVLVSSWIYNNISFSGLGALLDLTPRAADTMACKMIEQGRLKGDIDQVDKLIWSELAQ